MYTSIQCQADRKTLASTWCGHCRERVISNISDFQTRSGLIQTIAFLLERNQALGRGEGLQLRLSGRSTATAAHSGLQPAPDTVVRLFDRHFYLMLFLCSLRARHCGRAACSIRALEADPPASNCFRCTAAPVQRCMLLPHAALALQPASPLILAVPSPSLTNLPPDCSSTSSQQLGLCQSVGCRPELSLETSGATLVLFLPFWSVWADGPNRRIFPLPRHSSPL